MSFLAGAVRSQFGQGIGHIFLDRIQCTGNETCLMDCDHNVVPINNCSHCQDAGVICHSKFTYELASSEIYLAIYSTKIKHIANYESKVNSQCEEVCHLGV